MREHIDWERELSGLAVTSMERIDRGFSKADKYILSTTDKETSYLLKLYPPEQTSRRLLQAWLLRQHALNGVKAQMPVRFGRAGKDGSCYLVLTYLDGASGERELPSLNEPDQYRFGLEAGRQLRRIHHLKPPLAFDWHAKRLDKYGKKRAACARLGLTFHRQEELERYITQHAGLLRTSPVRFQHDDYHPQNLILSKNGEVGVIDFDSFDWGDPLEEFFKLPKYTVAVSRAFARGQVDGYFDERVPALFWHRYNLFVALNQHASQLGGHAAGRLEEVRERTRQIVETHDWTYNGPPEWYRD
ncbi:aminoglycoside phosphotransferase [Paenibacillus sp. J31TS4]|uniref:aminoglycoside phosphotransferase family protein n=1 Tax=Paenibacillus sp. J31TS4 TaxID=2807195 RepID=UPI001B16DA93|nr:aminoglycoside phosphotransferase family protein [Paenibacillus sp. J31TS4]GIP37149.1 aminoglycoside phosphotransferase [Paenibacillus sp. J31TS4]